MYGLVVQIGKGESPQKKRVFFGEDTNQVCQFDIL